MKLNKNFITHNSDGKLVMVSLDRKKFSGLVKGSETTAFIINKLQEETSREEIIDAMLKEYDASEEIISKDVDHVLDVLRKIGAIDE